MDANQIDALRKQIEALVPQGESEFIRRKLQEAADALFEVWEVM